MHAATNLSEVFIGTDSGIIAGNVKLTTGTNSTSNTTGDLVVAGGVGITQDVNIGGLLDVDGTLRVTSTSRFDDSIVLQGASKTLQLNNGSGTTRVELQSTTGNASFHGVVDITNNLNVNTDKFNVTASNGNTQIAGAVDANSTLNVAGFTRLEDTNEPTLAATGTDNAWEVQSNDYGAFRFDGGGYVEGDTLYNSDIYINGLIIQKETTTEVFNEQNNLRIRKKLFAGSQQELIPSYASHANANLKVFGGAGIRRSLHIGARQSGEGLFIGKLNSGSNIEFQVIGDTGNTTIGRSGNGSATEGLLTVYGDTLLDRNVVITGTTEFNGTVDVDADFAVRNGTTDMFTVDNVTGNTDTAGTLHVQSSADFDSTLNVDGNTTLGGTLTVAAATEFNGTVDVDANFAVRTSNTDMFTVNSATGNVSTSGTLYAQGETRIDNTLRVRANNEEFVVENASGTNKFSVDTDNGNTDIQGTLDVNGATNITNTLGVTGVTSITNATAQTLGSTYSANGAFRLTGGAGIGGNLAVSGNTKVFGTMTIVGSTTQTGNITSAGRVDVTNTSDATTFADGSVALVSDGGFRVSKQAWVGGDFHVWDNANNRDTFTVDVSAGTADLYGRLVAGSLQVDDSDVIAVGTGDDFTLTHDGTDTYLDNDTGNVYLRNNVAADVGGDIYIQAKSGENSIVATHDAGVDLYHNNVVQLSTTAAGVTLSLIHI